MITINEVVEEPVIGREGLTAEQTIAVFRAFEPVFEGLKAEFRPDQLEAARFYGMFAFAHHAIVLGDKGIAEGGLQGLTLTKEEIVGQALATKVACELLLDPSNQTQLTEDRRRTLENELQLAQLLEPKPGESI